MQMALDQGMLEALKECAFSYSGVKSSELIENIVEMLSIISASRGPLIMDDDQCVYHLSRMMLPHQT